MVPTLFGEIKVDLDQRAGFSMGLTVPKGTKAVAAVPKKGGVKSVTINDKPVYANGKGSSSLFAGECERWIKFNVAPGEWDIKAK